MYTKAVTYRIAMTHLNRTKYFLRVGVRGGLNLTQRKRHILDSDSGHTHHFPLYEVTWCEPIETRRKHYHQLSCSTGQQMFCFAQINQINFPVKSGENTYKVINYLISAHNSGLRVGKISCLLLITGIIDQINNSDCMYIINSGAKSVYDQKIHFFIRCDKFRLFQF